ncbi:MAG: hypothetical protein ACOYXC_02900 [Candidatus Rifleibacteriota bacterium]
MKKFLALLFIMFFPLSFLYADGGAERPATAEEKAFFQNTWKKIVDFLPPESDDYEKSTDSFCAPTMLGVGQEKFPLPFNFFCSYQNKTARNKAMDAAKALGENPDSMNDVSEKLNEITEEVQKAAMAGDQKKLAELQKKMEEIVSGNNPIGKMNEISKEQERKSLTIDIWVNATGCDYYLFKEIPAPANASLAIRRERGEKQDPQTVLFFGPYQKKGEGDNLQIYAERKPGTGTKVHYMYLTLDGENEICDEFIKKMNLAGLAGLLK